MTPKNGFWFSLPIVVFVGVLTMWVFAQTTGEVIEGGVIVTVEDGPTPDKLCVKQTTTITFKQEFDFTKPKVKAEVVKGESTIKQTITICFGEKKEDGGTVRTVIVKGIRFIKDGMTDDFKVNFRGDDTKDPDKSKVVITNKKFVETDGLFKLITTSGDFDKVGDNEGKKKIKMDAVIKVKKGEFEVTLKGDAEAEVTVSDGMIDIAMEGVDDGEEETVGGFVLINADNDRSEEKEKPLIPEIRDFEVDETIEKEDDLVKITLTHALPGNPTGTFKLSVMQTGRAQIKVWESEKKGNNPVVLPKTFQLNQLPKILFVEGIKEGKAARTVMLIFEFIENNKVICSDKLNITVTPVLVDLKITGFGQPEESVVGDQFAISSSVGGKAAGTLSATMIIGPKSKSKGSPQHVQTAGWLNNLKGGFGAKRGDGMNFKHEFIPKHAGMQLIDSKNKGEIPFYNLGKMTEPKDNMFVITHTDSPNLVLERFGTQILPFRNAQKQTEIDVSADFTTHAVWEFEDGTIYFLGKTKWSIRFAGIVKKIGVGDFAFTATEGKNGNNSSTGFTRTNALAATLKKPVANDGGAKWTPIPAKK